MDLIHNRAFRINSSDLYPAGLYRVILDEPLIGKTITVRLDEPIKSASTRGGRKKMAATKRLRKKAPPPLVGDLIWMERTELVRLVDSKQLVVVEIERDVITFSDLPSQQQQVLYDLRLKAMACFLDLHRLRDGILVHEGLGGLVRVAMEAGQVSRTYVYKQWSTLCKLGIDAISLRPRFDRSGAPGSRKPCDAGGRKKPGAKTLAQINARAHGHELEPEQPAMSSEWRAAIIAADKSIGTVVKPDMPARYKAIVDTAFVRRYRYENGVLAPIEIEKGTYPNYQQVKRVLTVEVSRLQQLMERTTKGHFKRALRGLVARNWKGVAGPGHTWAIDSTVADIYLRSSINRAWIVGRPIVYIIADVWSTAIVGFYVCLTGPSWHTAKVSLFNAVADPALMGDLWGFQVMRTLSPYPTMCYMLMCDRGEYLSIGARQTAIKLIPRASYAPPYRPDLKGLVEVLHRIEKDKQFLFMPGAMNYRRAEYELRRSNPDESAFTVWEYTQYLYEIFTEYNLTADRLHRVDAHMAAAGVIPSPAGLWRWGHEMGVGLRRSISEADLISTLLPSDTGRVRRDAVRYAGNDYRSDVVNEQQWTAQARNFGGWDIPVNYYPGSVSRIWTPNTAGQGLLNLKISDQANASPELTYDEVADAFAFAKLSRADVQHEKLKHSLKSLSRVNEMVANARRLTGEAEERHAGQKPTMSEARALEVTSSMASASSEMQATEKLRDEAMESHMTMMRALLGAVDYEGNNA